MSTITVPAGFVSLNAPLPSPPEFDLLAAAGLVDPTSNRWMLGAWSLGHPPGPAFTNDPCAQGTFRVKPDPGQLASQMAGRFNVGLMATCTAQGVGPDAAWLTDALEMAFQVYEGAAVERVMVSGDGHTTMGQFLGDANVEILGGTEQPLRALELLETAIAEVEGLGNGIIHAAPAVATAWLSQTLLFQKGRVLRTGLGTPVAVGAGYIGARPDGGAAPGADSEWAFASGPIQILRGTDIEIVPTDYAEAMDRSMNDIVFEALRPYLINWIGKQDAADDEHVQAAVLVDLTP